MFAAPYPWVGPPRLVHAPRSLPCETGLADAPGWYGGSGIAGTDAEPRGAGVADGGVRMTVGGVALWVSTLTNVKGEPGMLVLMADHKGWCCYKLHPYPGRGMEQC